MVKEFKIKFEEIEKLKKVWPAFDREQKDGLDYFFEPLSIEIDGVIINAYNDKVIKEDKLEYPDTLFQTYVTWCLEDWLSSIPDILSGKPQDFMLWDTNCGLILHRIDEKNIKLQFYEEGENEENENYNAAGKDFIIPIDMFINELIRASKEWIETRVVYCPKGEKDPDYIYIKEKIERVKQFYERYKKLRNIND